jgi:hypothetical protein
MPTVLSSDAVVCVSGMDHFHLFLVLATLFGVFPGP